MPAPEHRLGIDVGGTNTDAVIMDPADRVIAKAKVPCTPDITGGITRAIDTVLHAPGADPRRISHVMLGTTHATNAVLERRNLRRVAVIRIGGPATLSVRPMFGWPRDLTDTISVGTTIVDGGIEFDGRDLSPLDTDAIARFLGEVGGAAQGIVITSVFAPVSPRHELLAAEIVKRELGEIHVSLSHEIGSIGLLERENATILNGALAGVARNVAEAMRAALAAHHLQPTRFFAQNDGTLMGLDHALRYPVLTIGSGPANSVRGAAFLTGSSDSLVIDVGGTSTDVGVLVNGFPRESSQGVEIGGIRTNFRMPDLVTIALGGGSVISSGPQGARIGPRSVGYLLQREALIFGGPTPTLTDSAVAAGRTTLGEVRPKGRHRRAARRGAGPRRRHARRGDRPGEDIQGGSRAGRRGRRQHPCPRPHPRDQRGHPARALRYGQRRGGRHRLGQRPGGPDLPRRGSRAAGGPRRGARRGARARDRGGRRPRHGADRRAGRDPAGLPHLAIAPDPRQGRRHPRRPARSSIFTPTWPGRHAWPTEPTNPTQPARQRRPPDRPRRRPSHRQGPRRHP